MKVILQEKIANLGNVGDEVSIKPGYARNYLFPFGKAVPATAENVAQFEKHRAELEKKSAELLADAKERAKKLDGMNIDINAQASEEGKLYGSVGPREIAAAITEKGIELAKSEVLMPEGPIRQAGDYEIDLHLHGEVSATIKLKISAA